MQDKKQPKEQLYTELHSTWEEANKKGMTKKSFKTLLKEHQPKKRRNTSTTGTICQYISKCFNVMWTFILLLILLYILIAYTPPVSKALQTHLHDKVYTIYRWTRLSYLAIHPHLLSFGIDLSRICLIENPLVNETLYCPCIRNPTPVDTITYPSSSSPPSIVDKISSDNITIIHDYLTINEVYGRSTLLKYFSEHHQSPSACLHNVMGKEGPSSVGDIVNDNKWKEFMEAKEPWGYMWHDCHDFPSLRPYLPQLNDNNIKESNVTVYTLLTRWQKAFSYEFDDVDMNSVVLLVVQGTVHVKIDPNRHCVQYCIEQTKKMIMNQGDILIYDKRYWMYIARSWSETTFLLTIPFNKSSIISN